MFPLEIWIFFWQLIYTSVDRIDFVENCSIWSKVDSQGNNLVTVSTKLRLFTTTLSYITKTKYQVIKDSSHFLRLFPPPIRVFTRFLTILRKQKGLLLFPQQSLQIGNISSFLSYCFVLIYGQTWKWYAAGSNLFLSEELQLPNKAWIFFCFTYDFSFCLK